MQNKISHKADTTVSGPIKSVIGPIQPVVGPIKSVIGPIQPVSGPQEIRHKADKKELMQGLIMNISALCRKYETRPM